MRAIRAKVADKCQEILAKLVQMTAGAGMFPGDDEVDQLWIEMDAAARAPERLVGRMHKIHGRCVSKFSLYQFFPRRRRNSLPVIIIITTIINSYDST